VALLRVLDERIETVALIIGGLLPHFVNAGEVNAGELAESWPVCRKEDRPSTKFGFVRSAARPKPNRINETVRLLLS
jgi:hypothetical protein